MGLNAFYLCSLRHISVLTLNCAQRFGGNFLFVFFFIISSDVIVSVSGETRVILTVYDNVNVSFMSLDILPYFSFYSSLSCYAFTFSSFPSSNIYSSFLSYYSSMLPFFLSPAFQSSWKCYTTILSSVSSTSMDHMNRISNGRIILVSVDDNNLISNGGNNIAVSESHQTYK